MFLLAHISDLHLPPLPEPTKAQLCNKRVIGYINWKKNRGNIYQEDTARKLLEHLNKRSPDHLIISGDITNLALPQEFEKAKQWLSTYTKTENTSLTLGNHDCYVPGAFKKACIAFRPWLGDYMEENPKKNPFPYLRRRKDIALIGVSSAVAMPPFIASGYFDKAQAKQLRQLLKQAKQEGLFRVVFLHHPPIFSFKRHIQHLVNVREFQKVIFEEGAELILHGHLHRAQLKGLSSKDREYIPVVGAPCGSQPYDFTNKTSPSGYNWFAIEKLPNGWRCTFTHYALAQDNTHFEYVSTKSFLY